MAPSEFALNRDDITLSSRLVAALRSAVLDGDLEPGQHLKERALCEMFGVSRSLLREAVQKLVAEELITVVPHRGLRVTLLDRKSVRDLYRVRAVLEGLVCADFTQFADDASREELFKIADDLTLLAETDTPSRLIAAKNAFYACLLKGCGNEVVGQMFTQLNNRITQLRRLSLSQSGRLPDTLREIGAIIDAIRRRDPEAARKFAEEHVASAARVADRRLEAIEQSTNPSEAGGNP